MYVGPTLAQHRNCRPDVGPTLAQCSLLFGWQFDSRAKDYISVCPLDTANMRSIHTAGTHNIISMFF